jgi:hypothetical protein
MSRRIFDLVFRTKGLDKVKSDVGEADNKLESFGATAKTTATVLASTLGAATLGAGVKAIKTAGEFEMLRVRLRGLTGSQKEANRLFDEFNKIASQTPFSVQEVIDAGATLEAFGQDSEELLTGIADLAAFMQTDISTAAQNFGRAMNAGAGAADMFRDKGINQLVASFAGVDDVTELTLPEFQKALQEFIVDPAQPVAGATKLMAQTLFGQFSNAKDAVNNLAGEMGLKLLPTVKRATELFTEFIGDLDVNRVASYAGAITGLSVAFGAVRVATLLAANSMKAFKMALVTTGVGALVVGLGELINHLTKDKEATDELNASVDVQNKTMEEANRLLEEQNAKMKTQAELKEQVAEFAEVQRMQDALINEGLNELLTTNMLLDEIETFSEDDIMLAEDYASAVDKVNVKISKSAEEFAKAQKEEVKFNEALKLGGEMFGHLGAIAGSTSQLLATLAGADKQRQIQALEIARIAAIANIAQGITKAIAQGGIFGIATGASVAAAGAAQIATISNQISELQAAQFGMDEMVSRPTLILAGEAGPERVQVTPADRPSSRGGGGLTLNFNGPVTDKEFIRDTVIPEIQRVQKLGLA